MIFHLQFGFSQFISFREEDLWNFSQSEHIIGPGSHIEYPTGTKNSNFVEYHPRNIPAKFGSNRPSGFGEEAWNVKSLQTTDDRQQTTDDGRQVMAIVHMDLWSRWTNNGLQDKNHTATWDVMEQLCVIFTANVHKYLRLSPNKEDIYSRQEAVLPSLLIIYVIG
jgi:hypothetical protein